MAPYDRRRTVSSSKPAEGGGVHYAGRDLGEWCIAQVGLCLPLDRAILQGLSLKRIVPVGSTCSMAPYDRRRTVSSSKPAEGGGVHYAGRDLGEWCIAQVGLCLPLDRAILQGLSLKRIVPVGSTCSMAPYDRRRTVSSSKPAEGGGGALRWTRSSTKPAEGGGGALRHTLFSTKPAEGGGATSRSTLLALRTSLYALRSTLYALRSTPYALRSTPLRTSHFALRSTPCSRYEGSGEGEILCVGLA